MSERTKKIVRLAREIMSKEIDEVNFSSSVSNDNELPAPSTQVSNINHDQSNYESTQWDVVESTPTTIYLKKLESSEHGTTSYESEDVVSSGSGEMYDPSSSDESSDSNLSPSSPFTSSTNNAETQLDETQLHEPSPTVRGKKRTRNVENWCKVKAKLLRNSGKSCIGRTGKTVPPRKMGPSCKDKCILSCSKKFTEQYRVQLFTDYWAMGSIQRQRDFLNACIEKLAPKYRRITDQEPRKPNCAFYLRDNNTNKVRVCKTFMINTLGISERAIRTVIGATLSGTGIASLEDKRGKHANRKKIDEEILISVRNHINSIPRVESHYVRKDPKREFIDGGLTIADMHRQYSAERSAINMQPANYDTYARIFNNEFNIGFFLPKKDQCEAYKNAVNDDKKELEDAYHLHQEEKELSRLEKAADKEKSQKGEIKLAVYDLQAVLPVPMGQTSAFYYKSRLNCFNFTVTEIGSDQTVCFFWHEGLGHRGVNEIGTGVYKYLDACSTSSPGQDVVLYSDNCGGQQKNRYMIALYLYAVEHLDIQSITHKYLIRGHTQNEGDAVHSIIERSLNRAKKSGPIYVPDQYVSLIRNAKKKGNPLHVNEMSFGDFYDFKALYEEMVPKLAKNTNGDDFKLQDVKILRFQKGEDKFFYKTSYKQEEWIEVEFKKRKSRSSMTSAITLKPAYTEKIALTNNKLRDLNTLFMKNLIPTFYRSFYDSLK